MAAALLVSVPDQPVPDEVMASCRREAHRLESLCPRITGMWMTLGRAERPPELPTAWHVHLAVALSGVEVIVDRDPPRGARGESIGRAVRDACERARRKIEHLLRRSGAQTERGGSS
jgi:hypothetical protein